MAFINQLQPLLRKKRFKHSLHHCRIVGDDAVDSEADHPFHIALRFNSIAIDAAIVLVGIVHDVAVELILAANKDVGVRSSRELGGRMTKIGDRIV